ncbi:MAG TPA: hypothetical protein DIT13_05975, partial [Verrucomicrobiales bacterium]|nr:hypothetical protein [Verrucomicrobiales bacterium]
PRWQALLRLPALRAFWVAELRASHHAHLLKMTPHVWLMDETPLPPGSVIAGLGIPDWSHLPRLAGTGRRFRECGMENKNRALIEIQPGQTGRVLARYERQGERIVFAGADAG